jgi:polyisoprenoid-binding protein YceI
MAASFAILLAVAFPVSAEESRMTVRVGTAGLFKMFGHEHEIEVRGLAGRVEYDFDSPERSRFVLEIDAASLRVADAELSEEDRVQVQSDMESKALALPRNPRIVFESMEVRLEKSEGASRRLRVRGTLALRGVSKPLDVPLTLEVAVDRLTAKGEMTLESGNWGVPQVSAVGGSVKTSQDLGVTFEIVALRELRPGS